jgi:hypothetical protein
MCMRDLIASKPPRLLVHMIIIKGMPHAEGMSRGDEVISDSPGILLASSSESKSRGDKRLTGQKRDEAR